MRRLWRKIKYKLNIGPKEFAYYDIPENNREFIPTHMLPDSLFDYDFMLYNKGYDYLKGAFSVVATPIEGELK